MKRGRPRLPDHERRAETLRLRVTVAEADNIIRAACAARSSVSEYLRHRLGLPATLDARMPALTRQIKAAWTDAALS